jgi:hypothetical protein
VLRNRPGQVDGLMDVLGANIEEASTSRELIVNAVLRFVAEGLVVLVLAAFGVLALLKVTGWFRRAGTDTSQWMSAPGTVIAHKECKERRLHLRVQFATIKGQIVVFEEDVDRDQLGFGKAVTVMYDPIVPSTARVLTKRR